ncbi:hypothetical protein C8R44DRAFT_770080 [Mycena epipterygia]|nr:hypothetical protein C8R44DRAFT_770080 [Mycena epipterygia]
MQTVADIIDSYADMNDPQSDFDPTADLWSTVLASLDVRISELRQLISLRNERRKNTTKLRAITSLRHLPPEILSLISMNCPHVEVEVAIRNPSPLLAPLLLTQVCSRWRRIVQDRPVLWTELQLVLVNGNKPRDTVMLTNGHPMHPHYLYLCLWSATILSPICFGIL